MERKVNAELRAKGAGSDSPLGKVDVEGVIISETSWHSKKREREKKNTGEAACSKCVVCLFSRPVVTLPFFHEEPLEIEIEIHVFPVRDSSTSLGPKKMK